MFLPGKKEMKSSKFKNKYKALILDVDGTTIPNKENGIPSRKVIEAINKAKDQIHVGLATSRPLTTVWQILDKLELSSPCILAGGSYIIDPLTRRVLWQKRILKNDLKKVLGIIKEFKITAQVLDGHKDVFVSDLLPKNPLHIWVRSLSQETTDKVIDKLSTIPTISVYRIVAWEKGKFDIVVSHAEATKQHGILEVAKILNISTHEIIGVGDGYNDFPLLMACGLKVAMGNAVPDLKEIADYVAPTVEEDGVADVIDKFIL